MVLGISWGWAKDSDWISLRFSLNIRLFKVSPSNSYVQRRLRNISVGNGLPPRCPLHVQVHECVAILMAPEELLRADEERPRAGQWCFPNQMGAVACGHTVWTDTYGGSSIENWWDLLITCHSAMVTWNSPGFGQARAGVIIPRSQMGIQRQQRKHGLSHCIYVVNSLWLVLFLYL